MAHDGEDVAGETGVVEGGGEVLGAAAVAHVHADDVAPARQSLLALPTTYCELDEPSRPWTMMAVGREARTSAGCQWQWQRTWLAIWLSVAGETSTSSASGGGRRLGRGRKLPRMVWRWPLAQEAARLELGCGGEWSWLGVVTSGIDLLCLPGLECIARGKLAALRAPVGSSSCLK